MYTNLAPLFPSNDLFHARINPALAVLVIFEIAVLLMMRGFNKS